MSDELRPCHRCGQQPMGYVHDNSTSDNCTEFYRISCKCGMGYSSADFWNWIPVVGYKRDPELPTKNAIKVWNTRPIEDDLRAKLATAVEALEVIAKKSACPCWIVPGMGSGKDYKWKGCEPHLSDDPEEWCICCQAHEALAKIRST